MYVFCVPFQTIWIKSDSYQGFHVWGHEGEQTWGKDEEKDSGSLLRWSAGMLV